MIKIEGKTRKGNQIKITTRYTVDGHEAVEEFPVSTQDWLAANKKGRKEIIKAAVKVRREEISWAKIEKSLAPLIGVDLEKIEEDPVEPEEDDE